MLSFVTRVRAYLGLGANLGVPAEAFDAALDRLNRPYTTVLRSASRWGSTPMGPPDQPPYLNTVVEVETLLTPIALLAEVKAIERRQGRIRDEARWGPRILDVDVLLYGLQRIHTAALKVPHPGLAERRFVLAPLFELAPDLVVPGAERTVRDLLEGLSDDPASVWLDTGSARKRSSQA